MERTYTQRLRGTHLCEVSETERIKGTYVLVLKLESDAIVKTKGRNFSIEKGYYVYVGSAINGLFQRIQRHLKREKKKHWHIDFLLDTAKVIAVIVVPSEHPLEKRIASVFTKTFLGVSGFGASDSKSSSHLFKIAKEDLGKLMELVFKCQEELV